MIHAQADTMEAFKLSIWYEQTKAMLLEAARDRNMVSFGAAVKRIDSDRFEELPLETKRELDNLYALAVARTGAGAA